MSRYEVKCRAMVVSVVGQLWVDLFPNGFSVLASNSHFCVRVFACYPGVVAE